MVVAKAEGGNTPQSHGGLVRAIEKAQEHYKEQAKIHPGLALRTMLYRYMMFQRGITLRDVADYVGVSYEVIRTQFVDGLRGAEALDIETVFDPPVETHAWRGDDDWNDLDLMDVCGVQERPGEYVPWRRRPWLDLLDEAITAISDERGYEFPDKSIRPHFQAALERAKTPPVGDGEPVLRFPR